MTSGQTVGKMGTQKQLNVPLESKIRGPPAFGEPEVEFIADSAGEERRELPPGEGGTLKLMRGGMVLRLLFFLCLQQNQIFYKATHGPWPFTPIFGGSAEVPRTALAICKTAHLIPSAVMVNITGQDILGLDFVDLEQILSLILNPSNQLIEVSAANVPLQVAEASRVHVFRPQDGGEEHYAIEIGNPDRNKSVLSRLHSACFTGDLIGSLKCDCGHQLQAALEAISVDGSGVLLYMNQEGRGIGLANKMRAYALQNQGFDTVEANHRLGFEDDERNFKIGAEILRLMGFESVRLMTNNPQKVASMEVAGITVSERVPLQVGSNPLNEKYLETKAKKSGHIL